MTNQTTPGLKAATQGTSPLHMSVGAGIAIAGIWIAATALSGFLSWVIWIWLLAASSVHGDRIGSAILLAVLIWLNASPVVAATAITRLIVKGKEG